MRTLPLALCALLAGTALGAGSAWAGEAKKNTHEWPCFKGNPGFTGVSPDTSVKPPLKLLWSYRTDSDTSGDAGAGSTVAGGKVFLPMAKGGSILALDAHTGEVRACY